MIFGFKSWQRREPDVAHRRKADVLSVRFEVLERVWRLCRIQAGKPAHDLGRVPYELLTGDLSQVNYSSIRAGLVEFRRQIDAVQWQLFIPMFCAPTWRWFTEAAWAAGQIPTPDVPVEWSPPKFEAVDPQKDAMANLLSIRSGTMTLAEVIAKQGRNPDAVLAEIAATNAKLDTLGLVLDSDPRRVTKTGSAQTSDPANDPVDDDPANAPASDPADDSDTDPARPDPDQQD